MEEKRSFKEFLCTGTGKAGLIIVLYAVIFGLFLLTFEISEFVALLYGAIFAFFGWKSLTRIQPSIFLIMPLIGWVLYFVIKGALSIVVGMFVAPFVIAKKLAESVQNTL